MTGHHRLVRDWAEHAVSTAVSPAFLTQSPNLNLATGRGLVTGRTGRGRASGQAPSGVRQHRSRNNAPAIMTAEPATPIRPVMPSDWAAATTVQLGST